MANVAHASLTGSDLHEPKGVSAASSGTVYIADGAGSGSWTTLADIAQTVYTSTGARTTASSAFTIPFDDTIPQSSEGLQVLSLGITPTNASSLLHISALLSFSTNGAGHVTAALFKAGVGSALIAIPFYVTVNGALGVIPLDIIVSAGSTSAQTYNVNIGGSGGLQVDLNGNSSSRVFGGVCLSSLKIVEYLP